MSGQIKICCSEVGQPLQDPAHKLAKAIIIFITQAVQLEFQVNYIGQYGEAGQGSRLVLEVDQAAPERLGA